MASLVTIALVFTWAALAFGVWFGYQLFRQNGRVLLRLEALEDEIEQIAAAGDKPRAKSFGDRSLAGSRINRNGLAPGTPAPGFRLPRIDGGELSLDEYAGRRVLLVFSDPACGPCNQLAPKLEQLSRQTAGVDLVMVSRGDAEVNRRKAADHGLSFPVVLQHQWEISRLYAKFATPIAYLIDERGVVAERVAMGVAPILSLLSSASSGDGRAPAQTPARGFEGAVQQ